MISIHHEIDFILSENKVRMVIHDCDIYNWRQEIDNRVEYWIQELVQDNQ